MRRLRLELAGAVLWAGLLAGAGCAGTAATDAQETTADSAADETDEETFNRDEQEDP